MMRYAALFTIVACVFASELRAQTTQATRPNVLFLVADDLCADLGCYGAPVKTPNIDRLASHSVRFDRAYCQYPLCGPSRCSFMSGLRPDTTGVLTNGLPVRHKIKDVVTLPQLFRQHGYFVARVGKIYHLGIPGQVGQPGPDDPQSWDYTFNPKGNEFPSLDDGDQVDPDPKNGQSFRHNLLKGDGRDQHDYQAADEAIRLLREHKDKPFFLAVGFIRPHVPEVAPRTFFDLYPLEQIGLPDVPADDRDIPAIAIHNGNDMGMTPQQCRESIRAYRAATSCMDAQRGRVVDELQRLGLADNTVITFIGDHGYSLGQHHAWQKMMLFDRVARVPMIICPPGDKQAASTTPSLVESIDLYPTIAQLCGINPPQAVQGKSMTELLKDSSKPFKPAAYTQVNRGTRAEGRSVRTDRWRYTEWTFTNGGETSAELYDEQNDPNETKNLVTAAERAETVAQLKQLLAQQRQPGR
jgi:uncharacterized sulfatase